MKRTVVASFASKMPKSLRDPLLQAWELAWGAHALVARRLAVWDANAYWPLKRSLAFSDALVGYAPLGAIFGSGTRAAIVRYNAVFLFSYALAAFGAYVLARQLGARPFGAAVAAAAYAFAPWRLAQENHLHVLSSGGVPLALALLLRAHGIRGRSSRGQYRPFLAVLGWLVAAWQVSLGFTVGLPLAYLLAGACIPMALLLVRRIRRDRSDRLVRRLAIANVTGVAIFVATVAVFAAPYVSVLDTYPESARTISAVSYYSPPLSGFVTPPAESIVLGRAFKNAENKLRVPEEMTLSPGFAVMALAVVGLGFGSWRRRVRIGLGLFAIGAVLVGLGMSGPGGGHLYELLFQYVPGWDAIRTPGRLVFLVSLPLSMLASDGTDALTALARSHLRLQGSWAAGLIGLALVGVVLIEGAGTTPMARVPTSPVNMRAIADPVFFLPSDISLDNAPMFFSIDGFPALVNGNSGFVPQSLRHLRDATQDFPDPRSVRALCAVGVRSVVVATAWFDPARKLLDPRVVRDLDLTVRPLRNAFVFDLRCRR